MTSNKQSFKTKKRHDVFNVSGWTSFPKSGCVEWSKPKSRVEVSFFDYYKTKEVKCPPAKPVRDSSLEQHLDKVLDLVEASRYLLDLKADWDENGSLPYEKEALDKASTFLFRLVRHAHAATGQLISLPSIMPGPEGSIDLLWERGRYRLLLNVPPAAAFVGYYGYNVEGEEVKGKIHSDLVGFAKTLAVWLAQTDS